MSFEFRKGNLLKDDAEALVNTVNCVGVMGKGIALSFKRKFPENYKSYKAYCANDSLKPGELYIFDQRDLFKSKKYTKIINFATKKHWRSPSELKWVDSGLDDLNKLIIEEKISSIAIPPLGCGNGGLNWSDVLYLILTKLHEASKATKIRIYGEKLDFENIAQTPEHCVSELKLTDGRALLLLSIGELEDFFGGSITRLSAHKLFYFAQQIFGELGVDFDIDKFGPHSSQLDRALKALNKVGAIKGYYSGDGNLSVTPHAYAAAREFADNKSELSKTVDQLSKLIDGFESPFGMNLLGMTHYIANSLLQSTAHNNFDTILQHVEENQKKYQEDAVETAYNRLKQDGLLKSHQ